ALYIFNIADICERSATDFYKNGASTMFSYKNYPRRGYVIVAIARIIPNPRRGFITKEKGV
ncbi:hypothetical protein, partial [Lishizhenia sp.]|uniref:hypothetical protein n=1 Tax=Lishizhenia sp. TaxID=2497594 RepID=UPI00299DFFE1